MKVIGYLRVSTQEQEQSGLGLEAQQEKIRAYCGLYDLELVDMVQDAASGKSMKGREGLALALAMLARGEAEGLIVAKLDRLTRSVKDLGELIEKYFAKYSLFVVAEQVDTRTASGRLVLNLLTSVAQWERETIGERTAAALGAKRARGEKTGGAVPFGYDLVAGKLAENPQEQAVIRLIDDLKGRGHGYKAIAKELNYRGYTTKQGAEWKQMTVKRVVNRGR
ncbi:MAG: recombinase family protein [Candidatus Thermoplasmatota archaeon]|nr:recombinase family protein [Candidatus Thermoplasmatota archaeon]